MLPHSLYSVYLQSSKCFNLHHYLHTQTYYLFPPSTLAACPHLLLVHTVNIICIFFISTCSKLLIALHSQTYYLLEISLLSAHSQTYTVSTFRSICTVKHITCFHLHHYLFYLSLYPVNFKNLECINTKSD